MSAGSDLRKRAAASVKFLKKKDKILFLVTSNRWIGEKELPKSTTLAYKMAELVPNVRILDVSRLNIYQCEGNVSTLKGNSCGQKDAALKDSRKNPSGNHRCWASINNPDDELWKVSRLLLNSDCVVFFGSIRWGQMNAVYQKLIERLTWLENRHSTLGEDSIIGGIDVGVIAIGHNWNGANAVATQKRVLKFYGFNVVPDLCWNWDFTVPSDESNESYVKAGQEFMRAIRMVKK